MSETLIYVLVLIPCLIVAIVFHEVAHGWAALMLGDTTARDRNRLSFNPIRHVDVVGTLLVPGMMALIGGPIFGWAKPVPVIASKLDNPRYGMMVVAAAGPGSNLLMAGIGAITLGLTAGLAANAGNAVPDWLATGLVTFVSVNIFLALFNLLPIPPFDGSHIVAGLLPRRLMPHWQKLQQASIVIIVILVAITWAFPGSGIIATVVLPPVDWLRLEFLGLADRVFTAVTSQ